jgi:hypothetical protein
MAFANVTGHNHCLATTSSYACKKPKSTAKIGFSKNKFNNLMLWRSSKNSSITP